MTLCVCEQVGDGLAGDVSGDMPHQAGDGDSLGITVFMPGVKSMSSNTFTEGKKYEILPQNKTFSRGGYYLYH